MLQLNTALTKLDLRELEISAAGITRLSKALESNKAYFLIFFFEIKAYFLLPIFFLGKKKKFQEVF